MEATPNMKIEKRICKCYYCNLTSKLEWEYSSLYSTNPIPPIQDAIPVICNRYRDGTPEGGFARGSMMRATEESRIRSKEATKL